MVNGVSRFAVAERALRAGAGPGGNEEVRKGLEGLVGEVGRRLEEVRKFIREFGKGKCIFWRRGWGEVRGADTRVDPDDIYDLPEGL